MEVVGDIYTCIRLYGVKGTSWHKRERFWFIFWRYLVRISAGKPTILWDLGGVLSPSMQMPEYTYLKLGHDRFHVHLYSSLK
jgi:hypothetical protein